MIVQESVSVEQKTRAAGKLVVDFVGRVKVALKGGMPILEAVSIAQAAIVDLVPLIAEIDVLKAEAVEDYFAEAQTALLMGKDLYNALKA